MVFAGLPDDQKVRNHIQESKIWKDVRAKGGNGLQAGDAIEKFRTDFTQLWTMHKAAVSEATQSEATQSTVSTVTQQSTVTQSIGDDAMSCQHCQRNAAQNQIDAAIQVLQQNGLLPPPFKANDELYDQLTPLQAADAARRGMDPEAYRVYHCLKKTSLVKSREAYQAAKARR